MKYAALLLPLILGYCTDETLTGYGAEGKIFVLQSIDGVPFTANATISFPEEGRITGQAPCNSYSATQQVPYPWFKAGTIVSTKRACPEMKAETQFFQALEKMTLSEVSNQFLILSTPQGDKMEFEAN